MYNRTKWDLSKKKKRKDNLEYSWENLILGDYLHINGDYVIIIKVKEMLIFNSLGALMQLYCMRSLIFGELYIHQQRLIVQVGTNLI